jgi:hypothetical protein
MSKICLKGDWCDVCTYLQRLTLRSAWNVSLHTSTMIRSPNIQDDDWGLRPNSNTSAVICGALYGHQHSSTSQQCWGLSGSPTAVSSSCDSTHPNNTPKTSFYCKGNNHQHKGWGLRPNSRSCDNLPAKHIQNSCTIPYFHFTMFNTPKVQVKNC